MVTRKYISCYFAILTTVRLQLVNTLILVMNVAIQTQTALAQQTQSSTAEPVEVYVWGQQPTSAATEQTR